MKPADSPADERAVGTKVDGAAAAFSLPVSVDKPGAVIKILVVDDDDFMRDLLRKVLARAGMQVVCHGSAVEVLSAGDLATATVLLLDVNLPGMSGLDLQDLLRHRGLDLPVVFISGAADLTIAVTAMRNGAVRNVRAIFEMAHSIKLSQEPCLGV